MPSKELNKVYHVLNIPEKEQAFIQDALEDLQRTYLQGKAISAVGEVSEGLLGNPNLVFLVAGGLLAGLGAYFGKDKIDDLFRYFGAVERLLSGDLDAEEKTAAVSDMVTILKGLLPFGFLFPDVPSPPEPFIAPEPTPEERAVQEEKIRRRGEIGL